VNGNPNDNCIDGRQIIGEEQFIENGEGMDRNERGDRAFKERRRDMHNI
jgi:hypothetical protein